MTGIVVIAINLKTQLVDIGSILKMEQKDVGYVQPVQSEGFKNDIISNYLYVSWLYVLDQPDLRITSTINNAD